MRGRREVLKGAEDMRHVPVLPGAINLKRTTTKGKIHYLFPGLIILLCFGFLFALPAPALAQLEFKIGTEAYSVTYKEPGIMKESGVMKGVAGSCKYSHKSKTIEVEGRFASGTVDYSSNNTGSIDNKDNYTTEWRILGGQSFRLTKNSTLTPYIGWGFRKLHDEGTGRISTTGHFNYDRTAVWQYSPIGIKVNSGLNGKWSIETTIEYDFFWRGKQKSQLGDADPAHKNITNVQEKGHGARISLSITRKFQNFSLEIKPFIRSWFIEDSNPADSGAGGQMVEPGNRTFEIGTAVSVGF